MKRFIHPSHVASTVSPYALKDVCRLKIYPTRFRNFSEKLNKFQHKHRKRQRVEPPFMSQWPYSSRAYMGGGGALLSVLCSSKSQSLCRAGTLGIFLSPRALHVFLHMSLIFLRISFIFLHFSFIFLHFSFIFPT